MQLPSMLRTPHAQVSAGIVASTLVVSLLAKLFTPGAKKAKPKGKGTTTGERHARQIVRQAIQLARASEADAQSPLGLVRASQSLAYLEAAGLLVDPTTLRRSAPDTDLDALMRRLRERQARVLDGTGSA